MSLLTEEIREFVNRTMLGFVATVCPDGTPNLSPKGTTIAWDENHLAFADIYSPGTTNNLLLTPSVEINVVDVFSRKGYRFKGLAEVLRKGELFEAISRYYQNAGSQYTINNIVWVRIDQVFPLFSPAYDRLPEGEIINRWIDYWSSIYPLKKEFRQ